MSKSDVHPLYQVPQDYEAFLGASGEDEAWYLSLAQGATSILDLGTGTGRLALRLAGGQREVWGLDYSPAMLAVAARRARAEGQRIQWVQADLASFDLQRHFDLILLPYNLLQHLCEAPALHACLAAVVRHLAPGGRVALDLHQPQVVLLARDPDEWFGVEAGPAAADGWNVVAEQSRWDPTSQVLTQVWRLAHPDGRERMLRLPLRQCFHQELRALLATAGLEVQRCLGGFRGEAFGPASLRQVIVAGRPR